MNHKIEVYASDDYAGATTDYYAFYYGYESDWAFTVTNTLRKKMVCQLTYAELGQDQFDVKGCLIAGLALWGSK
jgi:hypothetical protein